MKTGISVFPARRIRPRTLLVLILLALPFNLLLFPKRSAALVDLSSVEKPIIDTWFAYTPDQVYQVLDALKEQGRNDTLAWAASFFTTARWVLGALAILSILLGLARYIWQRSFN